MGASSRSTASLPTQSGGSVGSSDAPGVMKPTASGACARSWMGGSSGAPSGVSASPSSLSSWMGTQTTELRSDRSPESERATDFALRLAASAASSTSMRTVYSVSPSNALTGIWLISSSWSTVHSCHGNCRA
eukprot:1941655-Prymnesium_polylepis.3